MCQYADVEVFELGELQRLHSSDGSADPKTLSRLLGALGSAGPGLIAIRGVPGLHALRQELLPLAGLLALLPRSLRSAVLKEHGLGTDVPMKDPHRLVSSFAVQLNFGQDRLHCQEVTVKKVFESAALYDAFMGNTQKSSTLQELGCAFKDLGKIMVEVGLSVAKVCDLALEDSRLEEAILESCTAKGRLIHYHSLDDGLVLSRQNSARKTMETPKTLKEQDGADLWQQWHLDYGIFTVLTVPMFSRNGGHHNLFTSSNWREVEGPFGHMGLKILNPCSGRVELVDLPADYLVVQVGEAAQILTGGKLRATAHCVCRVSSMDISRETYVAFLQPSWQKVLRCPDTDSMSMSYSNEFHECVGWMEETAKIRSKIPPLMSRWKDGCTFAEFSRETTRQYYGANGCQPNRK